MKRENLLLLILLIGSYVSWGQSTSFNESQFGSTNEANVACAISSATAGTPVYSGGTETTVTYDDGWSFPLTVNSSGTTNTTWQILDPDNAGVVLASGTYGQTATIYVYNKYFGSDPGSTVTFTVRDSYDYSCTKTFTLTQPSCSPAPCTGFSFSGYNSKLPKRRLKSILYGIWCSR